MSGVQTGQRRRPGPLSPPQPQQRLQAEDKAPGRCLGSRVPWDGWDGPQGRGSTPAKTKPPLPAAGALPARALGDETCAGPARGSLTARRPTPRTCVSLAAQLRVHRCLETCGHALGGRGAGSFCTSRAPGANAGNRHPPCCTAACGCPICPLTLAHSLWDPVRPDRRERRARPRESGGHRREAAQSWLSQAATAGRSPGQVAAPHG